jgi:hypothetical protein
VISADPVPHQHDRLNCSKSALIRREQRVIRWRCRGARTAEQAWRALGNLAPQQQKNAWNRRARTYMNLL